MAGEANNINNNRPATPPPVVGGPARVDRIETSPTEKAQDPAKAALPPKVRRALDNFPLTKKGTDGANRASKESVVLEEGFGIILGNKGDLGTV